ncbi:MAG: tetratricopeptide repeat protein [Pseudomonadota bacterium]
MSLLLDALKKAEHGKQGSSLSLEPIDNRALLGAPASATGSTGSANGNAARRADQGAAQTVFTAKQPPPLQNRALWLLLGGLSLLCIAAGVFWLWYMLSYPPNRGPVTRPSNVATQPMPAPAPTAVPASSTIAKDSSIAKLPSTASGRGVGGEGVSQVSDQAPHPQALSRLRERGGEQAPVSHSTSSRLNGHDFLLKPSPREAFTVNPTLASAYQALTRADYLIAKQEYQTVIRDDPFNLDAYLGLATIAASTNDPASAQAYYQKSLEIDPKNAVAQAGLAAMRTGQNASASESQLRMQANAQPDAVSPQTALGHAYAAQAKWNEAQQAFFEAYRLEPTNPDHAFNLAISLDHLKQTKLAREYYGKALSLSESRSVGFNKAEAAARLEQLAP